MLFRDSSVVVDIAIVLVFVPVHFSISRCHMRDKFAHILTRNDTAISSERMI